jgi:hypothetical protein
MSAKIYSAPSSIKKPELNFKDIKAYHDDCKRYETELKDVLTKRNSGKHVGAIIKFPVADGYARYMVASMRPLELVHIPLDDEWQFEYAQNLTAKDVEAKIAQEEAMAKLFSSKQKK